MNQKMKENRARARRHAQEPQVEPNGPTVINRYVMRYLCIHCGKRTRLEVEGLASLVGCQQFQKMTCRRCWAFDGLESTSTEITTIGFGYLLTEDEPRRAPMGSIRRKRRWFASGASSFPQNLLPPRAMQREGDAGL